MCVRVAYSNLRGFITYSNRPTANGPTFTAGRGYSEVVARGSTGAAEADVEEDLPHRQSPRGERAEAPRKCNVRRTVPSDADYDMCVCVLPTQHHDLLSYHKNKSIINSIAFLWFSPPPLLSVLISLAGMCCKCILWRLLLYERRTTTLSVSNVARWCNM